MASSQNYNNINTNTGNSIPGTVTQLFDQYPYLEQRFAKEIKECALENVTDCSNPPSITQIDSDIIKADTILEWLTVNDVVDKELQIFQFQTIIHYLKVKKCVVAQYPCWSDNLYKFNKAFLDNFDFSTT
jgi:hypothetical protein